MLLPSGRSSLCCLCLKPKSKVRCSRETEHLNGLVNILNSIHRKGQVSVVLQTETLHASQGILVTLKGLVLSCSSEIKEGNRECSDATTR